MNRIEKYRGRSPGEAMRKAREALGDDARLLGTRRISGAYDPIPAYEVSVTASPVEASAVSPGLADIRREIEELKGILRASAASAASPANTASAPPAPAPSSAKPARPDPANRLDAEEDSEELDDAWIDRLRRRGIARARAERLVREAIGATGRGERGASAHAVTRALAQNLAALEDPRPLGTRSTVFVGPAGAGKTTTLAKVAAELVGEGIRPTLVTTDGESVTGEDELARVAEALDLRFETAFFSGQLAEIAARTGSKDVLLVDTPGRAPFSESALDGLEETARSLDDAEIVLVLAASTEQNEARALVDGFRPLGIDRVVVTKLDELGRPGRFVELAEALGLPVARVMHGRSARGASSGIADPAVLARVLGSSGAVESKA